VGTHEEIVKLHNIRKIQTVPGKPDIFTYKHDKAWRVLVTNRERGARRRGRAVLYFNT
jgi:hypothetical protein